MWRLSDPQGNESAKVRYDVVPYTRGVVLDLGCGPFKAFPHFIGVDNMNHAEQFGWKFTPDVIVPDAMKLEGKMSAAAAKRLGLLPASDADQSGAWDSDHYHLIPDASCDAVFSSHLLEHIVDTQAALAEWWRVIKPGGHLCLYLPHKRFYPNIGEPGANPDHAHDFEPFDIVEVMKSTGAWDLVVNEERNADTEYSFLQVFQKLPSEGPKDDITIWDQHYSHRNPLPPKRALVVRYGGIGDMVMASSILPQLKDKGYHVTFMTTPAGQEVARHDPHIDAFILQDRDQVPNGALPEYWFVWAKKFKTFINLSESVEGNLLPNPGSSRHAWPDAMRQKYLNENYLEFQHQLAGLEYKPRPRFYATPEEKHRVEAFRSKLGNDAYVVLWCLAGSSVHKVYPHSDQVVAQLLLKHPNVRVIFVGDEACQILESQWEAEPRVVRLSGKIGVRETLALACHGVDCVIGPETGVLNAVSHLAIPKVIMLSHSSVKNLTRNWANTTSLMPGPLEAPCFPCHRLHHDRTFCPSKKLPVAEVQPLMDVMDDFERKIMDDNIEGGMFDTGAAVCAYGIPAERVTAAVLAQQTKRILVPA